MPKILQQIICKSRDSILEHLEDLMKTIYRLTAIVDYIIGSFGSNDGVEASVHDNDVPSIIETLTACRQQEIYIRQKFLYKL